MQLSICIKERTGKIMFRRPITSCSVVWLLACCMLTAWVQSQAHAELTFEPSWQVPVYEQVRQQVLNWLGQGQFEQQAAETAQSFWPDKERAELSGTELLDRTVRTIAKVNAQARKLHGQCSSPYKLNSLPDAKFLSESDVSVFARNNLSLYLARWQVQRGLYDEVIETLEGIEPADVVDPSSLLFYRMVAHHQVVHPEQSRAALAQLLEHEDSLPQRYRHVANLLGHDLSSLKDESLDHIARRMNDVRRRLELGRAGKKVQMVEKDIMDSLQKLIERLEQQSQQQSSSGSANGSQQGNQPMQDSQLPTMEAPMQVDQKDIGNKSGWGDLPPRQREEALQQIGRDFPAHYRELIEQYFRELAAEGESSER